MKHFFMVLCALLTLAGCTDFPVDEIVDTTEPEFYATIEGSDADAATKTYVDDQIRMRWTANDKITMFNRTTYLRQYTFTGKTGANAGGFKKTSEDDEFWYGDDVDNIYAVYPYSDDITLDETSCALTLNMPAEQRYAVNSFGLGANTMVSVSTGGQLVFKNVGSYLRVRLYGEEASISCITLTSLGEEAIAGEAEVAATLGGEPTCTMKGKEKSIKLTCPEPVQISNSADSPTDFWIVVPPVTLNNGFSVTIENSEGSTQTYVVNSSFTFERNKFYNLKREVEIVQSIPKNQIRYTSSDDEVITPNPNAFGAQIISNVYQNGKGIITFDGNVSEIGDYAFNFCWSLTSITIPEGVTTIDDRAFQACISLTGITIPESVTSIGDGAFFLCTSLTNITIPEGVTNISASTFVDCRSLTSITIPEGVTTIGSSAFTGCSSLTNITIPEGVTNISASTFANCSSLTSITIPEDVTSIGDRAFEGCSSLTSITIPEGVTRIGKHAFCGCSSLTSITIPEDVRSIEAAFYNCTSLTSITIPEGVTNIDWAFYGCCI